MFFVRRHLFAVLLVGVTGSTVALEPEKVAAWTQDLDFLVAEFERKEGGFTADERAGFDAEIAALRANLGTLDDEHVLAGIMRAVACARNGHTHANPPRADPRYGQVPIRFWHFADGVYVVRARPSFAHLLGARVVSVGGHPIDEAMSKTATLFYGNRSWQGHVSASLLAVPATLYGIDLSPANNRVEYGFVKADGSRMTETLVAEAPSASKRYQLGIWTLAPGSETADGEWTYALSSAPRYLQRPNEVLWYEYLKKDKALYIQYNSSVFPDDADRRALIEGMLEAVRGKGVEKVIVDLRLNGGGDLTQMRGAFNRMLREKVFEQPGRLYAITGEATFSAGLFHAANLKAQGATIVGELVGDDIDFWAEGGGPIELPNSKVRVYASTGFHSYSTIDYPLYEKQLYLNLDIDTLEPDMPVPMTFADFIHGRDAALARILAD